jgi:hypothetical protein
LSFSRSILTVLLNETHHHLYPEKSLPCLAKSFAYWNKNSCPASG